MNEAEEPKLPAEVEPEASLEAESEPAPSAPANDPVPENSAATKATDEEGNQNGESGENAEAEAGAAAEETDQDETALLQIELATLKEELERSRADYYNLNQEYSNYVRRSKLDLKRAKEEGHKAVFQVLLGVLDDIYAAESAGDLTGPFQAIANKLVGSLETNFGLCRYGEMGEEFDPNIHEALMAQENAEIETPQIAQVLQPGYKLGEEILRATKVIVNNPA